MAFCTKVGYKNKKKARQAAYAIKAKGHIPASAALEAYYCKEHQQWHLSRIDSLQFLNKVCKNESKRIKKTKHR